MKEITLEGWLVKDETEMSPDIHLDLPYRVRNAYFDSTEFLGRWRSNGNIYRLDKNLFPSVHWDSDPRPVKITICYPD
ncbi:MAG: hypothetical protein NC095_06600 [Muribaculum sp.]|nr:hypothetical protein [Muribaculum sp.]